MLRSILNQEGKESAYWKPSSIDKKETENAVNKLKEIPGYGLEEITLLKSLYCTKWSTESMQIPSKF
jgi:hypothetical protein